MRTTTLMLLLVIPTLTSYAAPKAKGDLYATIACNGNPTDFIPPLNINIFKQPGQENQNSLQVYLESKVPYLREEAYTLMRPVRRMVNEGGVETMIEIAFEQMVRTFSCIKPRLLTMDYLTASLNEVLILNTPIKLCGGTPTYFFVTHTFAKDTVEVSGYASGECTWTTAEAPSTAK